MARIFPNTTAITATITRNPDVSGGKRGTPETVVADLSFEPLESVDPELRQRLALDTPHELLQTFIEGDYDIQTGDFFTTGSTTYPIKAAYKWDWWNGNYNIHLILEDLKR